MQLKQQIKPAVKEPKSYGSITLNSSDFPEVKDLTLGDKKTITVEVDITSLRKADKWEVTENGMKPTDIIANIKVLNVTLPKKK